MFNLEEITIKDMIVHILDPLMSAPIFSKSPIEENPSAREFFMPHLVRFLNDDQSKVCEFDANENLFYGYTQDYRDEKMDFVNYSIAIGETLFAIMKNNQAIPAADLAVIKFMNKSIPYIALLKLNYQRSYIHDSDYEAESLCNYIIEYRTSLPSPSQRISEGVVINLNNLVINVVERSYLVDGAKQAYLSNMLLKCKTRLSSKEQLQIVKQATNQITKKYYDDNPEKKMDINKALYEAIQEDGVIQLETYADVAFKKDPALKEQFIEKIEKKGIDEPMVRLQEKTIERAFTKQKIKTDEGIEISLPMLFYQDPAKMEIVTDANGRMSIVLKDIGKIL